MILYRGDCFHLNMDIYISISKVIDFEPDDLKKYLEECARDFLSKKGEEDGK